jgi:tRNA modification GTPase
MSASTPTIAAIVTCEGAAGVAIVRLSGPAALDVAARLAGTSAFAQGVRSHRARAARLVDPVSGETLDEALLLPMRGPRSYTGEDVVEFQCHGGLLTARRVLRACLAAGAAAASPGEFTRRAFLNGRLSLDQAEAVADLIAAEDELAAGAALARLRGGLRDEIASVERPLLGLLADWEGALEFGEEETVGPSRDAANAVLTAAHERINALLSRAEAGRRARHGVHVALVGPPNAGKSSLFNALLGEERALVDPEPGTTRDVIEGRLTCGGVVFVLHDTAGLRADPGRVESLGINRTRATAERADLLIEVHPLDVEQEPLAAIDSPASRIRVGTRADRLVDDAAACGALAVDVLPTSAHAGWGLDALREALLAAVDAAAIRETAALGVALGARHRERLATTRDGLCELDALLRAGEAREEVLATLLGAHLSALGEISGRVYTETLLGEIFSRLCVGK